MASLGNIEATFTAHINDFTKKIDLAKVSMEKFAVAAERAKEATVKIFGSMGRTISQSTSDMAKKQEVNTKLINKSLIHMGGTAYEVRDTYKESAEGMVHSGRVMSKSADQSFTSMMKSMLNFKTFLAKIIHYVTFSIGVQLVMMFRQSFSQMIEDFRDFERALVNAIAVSGHLGIAFEDVYKRLSQLAYTLSKETIFSVLEITEAFYSMASAGIDIADATRQELLPILNYAAATQSELNEATKAVLTTMKAFGMTLEETERIVDTFTGAITRSFFTMDKLQDFMRYTGPIAGELGVALEETAAAGMLLVNMGLQGSQAGQRLNMILTKLLKPTDKAQETLAMLGISVEDINPELYSLTEIFWKLRSAGFGAAEASSLFRARTAASAAALVSGVGDIEQYNAQLLMSKGITESVASVQENTLFGAFKNLTNAMQRASLEIGESLAPILEKLAEVIGKSLAPFVTNLFEGLKQYLPLIIDLIKYFVIWKTTIFIITKALGALNFIITLVNLKTTIFAALTDYLGKSALGSLISGLYGAIKGIVAYASGVAVATPIMSAFAAAITIASFGLAAIAAAAALGAIGFFSFMDAAKEVVTAAEESGLAIKKLAGDHFVDLLHVLAAWQIAAYEASHTNKNFQESLYGVNKSIEELGIGTAIKRVDEFIDKSSDIEIISKAIQDLGLTEFKPMPQKYGEVFDFTDKIKEELKEIKLAQEFDPEWGQWYEFIPIVGFFAIAAKWLKDIHHEQQELASQKWFAEALGVSVKEVTNRTQILEAAIKSLYSSTIPQGAKFAEVWAYALRLSTETSDLRHNVERLKDTIIEEGRALKDLEQAKIKDIDNTEKLLELENRYNKAVDRRKELTIEVMSAIRGMISEIRNSSEKMNEAVNVVEEYFEVKSSLRDISYDLEQAYTDEERAVIDLSEALNTYSAGADQVVNAERTLYNASKRRAELLQQQSELETGLDIARRQWEYTKEHGVLVEKTNDELLAMGYNQDEIAEMLNKQQYTGTLFDDYQAEGDIALKVALELSETEKALIIETYDLADARNKLATATAEQTSLQAAENALINLEEKYIKFTNERMKKYLETLLKVMDIKLKLYKLRQDESKQLSDLFGKLAEEGLISENMIEGFKELQIAEGAVLKLNKPFADAIGNLTDAQREEVEQFMLTEKGMTGYSEELADLQKLVDKGIITKDELNTIIAMNDAQDNLVNTTKEYKDELGPVIQDLIDQDLVSSDAAEAWNKIADNELEAAEAGVDLALQTEKVSEAMESLINTNTRLAMSLIDEEGEKTIDVFDELIERLEITGKLAGSDASQLDVLNDFFETNYDSLSDFNDEQLITAASMIDIGQAAGLWEDGMTGTALALDMSAGSLQSVQNYARAALKEETSLYEVQKDLAKATKDVADAMSDLNQTMADMRNLMFEKIGIDPLIASLRYDIPALIEDFGTLDDVMKELGRRGLKVGNYLMDAWRTDDWEVWADQIKKSPELLKDIELATGLDLSGLQTGESWQGWFEDVGQYISNDLSDAINKYVGNIKLDVLFDDLMESISGTDLASALEKSLYEQLKDMNIEGIATDGFEPFSDEIWENILNTKDAKDTLVKMFEGFQILVDFDTTWDDQNWDTWKTELESKGQNIDSTLEQFVTTFNLQSVWDGKTFSQFMSAIPTQYIPSLISMLPEGINLPFDTDTSTVTDTINSLDDTDFTLKDLEFSVNEQGIIDDIKKIPPQVIHLRPEFISTIDMKELYEGLTPKEQIEINAKITGDTTDLLPYKLIDGMPTIGLKLKIPEPTTGPNAKTFFDAYNKIEGNEEKKNMVLDFLWEHGAEETINSIISKQQTIFGGTGGFINDETIRKVTAQIDDQITDKIPGILDKVNELDKTVTTTHVIETVGEEEDTSFWDILTGIPRIFTPIFGADGILALQKGITETTGPTSAIIGENGAEAVIPLEGSNRKYGQAILQNIIPKYFPDLSFMQAGGIVSALGELKGIEGFENGEIILKPLPDELETLHRILQTLQGIRNILSGTEGIMVRAPMDGIAIKDTITKPTTPDTGLPFRRGTTETVDTGGGTGASASAGSDVFNALVTVRQGGQKINMEIYLRATELVSALANFNNSITSTLLPEITNTANEFNTRINNSANSFYSRTNEASNDLYDDVTGAGDDFKPIIKNAADIFKEAVKAVTPIKVEHTHSYSYLGLPQRKATGGILGLKSGIERTRGSTFAMIGEEGPEAVVPLAGQFKDRGRDILEHIIPTYFPEMTRQEGGITDNSTREEFNVLGPVTVNGIANVDDMAKEFKYRYRTTR